MIYSHQFRHKCDLGFFRDLVTSTSIVSNSLFGIRRNWVLVSVLDDVIQSLIYKRIWGENIAMPLGLRLLLLVILTLDE